MHTPSELKSLFLDYMQQHNFQLAPKELFEPVDYILQLGGKRLRPVLLLMSHNLYQTEVDSALSAAYAYEIFHNFSLVHDDIMDEAPLRRGKATIHQKYDINTGILSGDVMLIYAYKYLLETPDKNLVPELMTLFSKVAAEVCIGQQYDMNFETSDSITIAAYLQMIEYKTASLIAGALKTGALLAGAPAEDLYHLYEFGRNLGIAFQLQDDILDTYGNAATFGKRIGGDIVQNKKTYLVLKAMQLANNTQKQVLENLLSTYPKEEEAKIATVVDIFDALDIKAIASEKKDEYHQKAIAHLALVKVVEERKIHLQEIAKELLERVK